MDNSTSLIKPNALELEFLSKAYVSYFSVLSKLEEHDLSSERRFQLVARAYSIYSECLKYEPIKAYTKSLEKHRPNSEKIALDFFEVIRHLLTHFPFFNTWDEVCFNKDLISWDGRHAKIDKFFREHEGGKQLKWRAWNSEKKEMNYGYTIDFPHNYTGSETIYLKDLITEHKGIELSLMMITRILKSQIVRD